MPDDAEALRLPEAAGGGGGELVRPADQKVTRGGVAAALGADAPEVRHLRVGGAPQERGEDNC